MTELRGSVIVGKQPLNETIAFSIGPPQRLDVFVGVIAFSPNREERMRQEAAVPSAANPTGAQRPVAIS